jgi:transposase
MDRSQDHFLTSLERSALQSLLRERKAAGLKIRRANALLLLDDGMAPIDIARVLYLDEETIRSWKRSFESDGVTFRSGCHRLPLTYNDFPFHS